MDYYSEYMKLEWTLKALFCLLNDFFLPVVYIQFSLSLLNKGQCQQSLV